MQEILTSIHESVQRNPQLSESEVKDIFVDEGFFSELGYEGFGVDIRSEETIVGKGQADYSGKDNLGNTIFTVEFKKPSRSEDLSEHIGQLWEQYVKPLKSRYGILTDGEYFILYERGTYDSRDRIFRSRLDSVTEEEVEHLSKLHKPSYDFNTKEKLNTYLDGMETVSIGESVDGEEVGKNEFTSTFGLDRHSIFYDMLESTYNLLDYYVSKEESSFPKDAFEFWEEYYSSDPKWGDLPDEWKDIAEEAANKQKIMFAVETVQSLLGRLMLSKACDDFGFPSIALSEFVTENTREYRGEVPTGSYIIVTSELMGQMRQELVESVFEQDIYYWWDAPVEDFDGGDVRSLSEQEWSSEVRDFDRQLLEFILSVSRFDYRNISGDPLGELYQEQFTREIRQALGEFYTPPSIAEYTLDSVGYDESNLSQKRLLDPACGSGTFLIQALEMYKEKADSDTNWAVELSELCERCKLVGLDIHPFAVVLAQIRFMLNILPEYGEAVEQEGTDFVLKRVPIYRTDTLIDESQIEEGLQRTLSASHEEGMIEFEMPLPIRKGSDFESLPFELPKFEHVQDETLNEIQNQQEYFSCLLAVFDAVKEVGGRQGCYDIEREELEDYFVEYFGQDTNIEQVSNVFLDTANDFLGTVEELRNDYNDGRLLKLIEDVVLASIIKNDISHDFVVGNPPWVAKQNRYTSSVQDRRMKQSYLSAWGEGDPYMEFMERGLDMLDSNRGGHLGFIVSNRFLYNSAAEEIRAFLAKNRIHEIIDFTDVPLFEGATNYSAIINVEKQVPNEDWSSFIEDDRFTNRHSIKATRVRQWDNIDEIPELMELIEERESHPTMEFFEIDSARFQERVRVSRGEVYREEESTTLDGVSLSKKLPSADIWTFCPDEEYHILRQVEEEMDMRLGDRDVIRNNSLENAPNMVGDDIHVGIQTSGDGVYVVHPTVRLSKEKLSEIDLLPITPSNIDETHTVETDLLKIDISSEDLDRWLTDWDDRLVFVPYKQGDERAELIRPQELHDEYPETWAYFSDAEVLETLSEESDERKEVHNRLAYELDVIGEEDITDEDGERDYEVPDLSTNQYQELSESIRNNVEFINQQNKELWWYRYMRRQNIESLPYPKVLTGNQKCEISLCFDGEGIMAPHNARVYSIALDSEKRHSIAGILNSALSEYYHEHHSRIHQGKAYSYIEDFVSKWCIKLPEERSDEIESVVDRILRLKDLDQKVAKFPDPYILEARDEGEEFVDVSLTPESDFEASPHKQNNLGGDIGLELDDGQLITEHIDSDVKAEYVQRALEGRELRRNRRVNIPVPLADDVAQSALDELDDDIEEMNDANIDGLEQQIDDIVFELYGITDEDVREHIYRYNRQHESVRPLHTS
jgi:methylase of polypeptide subunit release factors